MSSTSVTTLWALIAGSLIAASTPANADVIGAYFGWNYVADSAGSPPAVLDLTQVTYYGGAGGGETMNLPNFPGYTGMPDGIGLSYTPTYTTTAGGDGETTRTVHQQLPINWVAPNTPTPYGTYNFYTIGITNFTTSNGGAYAIDPNTANQLNSSLPYYVVGLIGDSPAFGPPYTLPLPSNDELLSDLTAPQGDIYDNLAGAPGNPQLTATDTPGMGSDKITVIFAAAPEPASLALLAVGVAGLGLLHRRRRHAPRGR